MDITMPNFSMRATNLYSPNKPPNQTIVDITIALEEVFAQGRALGRREALEESGYEDWREQEPDFSPVTDEERKNATNWKQNKDTD